MVDIREQLEEIRSRRGFGEHEIVATFDGKYHAWNRCVKITEGQTGVYLLEEAVGNFCNACFGASYKHQSYGDADMSFTMLTLIDRYATEAVLRMNEPQDDIDILIKTLLDRNGYGLSFIDMSLGLLSGESVLRDVRRLGWDVEAKGPKEKIRQKLKSEKLDDLKKLYTKEIFNHSFPSVEHSSDVAKLLVQIEETSLKVQADSRTFLVASRDDYPFAGAGVRTDPKSLLITLTGQLYSGLLEEDTVRHPLLFKAPAAVAFLMDSLPDVAIHPVLENAGEQEIVESLTKEKFLQGQSIHEALKESVLVSKNL